MAHELAFDEFGKAKMAYRGDVPWHGLGTTIDGVVTPGELLAKIGGDYEVKTEILQTPKGKQVEAKYTFYVDKNGEEVILGDHVGPDYTPLQNRDAVDWFKPFLEEGQVEFESAGLLRDGRRMWVLARLRLEAAEVVPGDKVLPYVLLSNAHDGTQSVRVGFTPIRVVCANTLHAAHHTSGSKLLRIRHTTNVKEATNLVRQTMDLQASRFVAVAETYKKMTQVGVNEKDMEKYIKKCFQASEKKEREEEAEELIKVVDRDTGRHLLKQILPGLETAPGADTAPNTLWAAYNGVTYFLSHVRGKDAGRRLESQWFGDSATVGHRAYKLALDILKDGMKVLEKEST